MSATSIMAAALVVAIVGVGVWNAQDSPVTVSAGTSTSASSPVHELGCETGVDAVPKADTPLEVYGWADGEPVVGRGELWTVRALLRQTGTEDNGIWRTKIGWFTRPFGIPTFQGRRLDGAGTFRAEANAATDQHGTWVASLLEFSRPGCWEVTASYRSSKIVFRILIGDPPQPLATGTIAGTLREIGGPSPGLDRAIPGTINIDGDSRSYGFSTTGKFSVHVAVGRYTATGTSPLINDGRTKCVAEHPVVVERGRTTRVTVVCSID